MERISDAHVRAMRDYLKNQLELMEELTREISKSYQWLPFPEPKRASVYAVDGSRMMKRLSGAIIYGVASVAIGENLYHWSEVGFVSPYKHVDERIRIHMELLEKRIGAMASEMGAELVLMDGTISGSIIRPPSYIGSNTDKMFKRHSDELVALADGFLKLLDEKWESWLETLERDGIINAPTLVARGDGRKGIFTLLKERGVEEAKITRWQDDYEDVIILLEYLEFLHALDRLLAARTAAIAKTFYRDDIVRQVWPGTPMLDVPVLDMISKEAGYVPFRYSREEKRKFPDVVEKLMDMGHFGNLMRLLDKTKDGYRVKVQPFYVRFVDGGVIYLLEVPGESERDALETLSMMLSVAEDEYVIPLEYAHHSVVIKKQEFDAYVSAVLSALVGEDERFLSFLRYGREPLE
ncbi:5'-3' exonuclease [Thermococcus celericrescens]|uniref:5'-3' exonuclease n=1 Tax=Thermococcus celericrescens TaxID=227598 RepID=A0A100XXK4_9EURY|nr:DNA double-strand break repair nuclease NurA [Thermococcus celericrescens]KUH33230.1 5'-3' exonuclease [Thermococcus celericrescens]